MKQWISKLWQTGRRPNMGQALSVRLAIHSDDLFLVSYPKSGNTWMRFLVANLLRSERGGGGDQPIDFHSSVRYVPEYELHANEVNAATRPRILKSHAPYDKRFPRVAYIVRDPRDVYVSYYHYLRKRLPSSLGFSGFIRNPDLHPCHWHEHVAGWIDRPNVHVVRYEDMLGDTHGELSKLITFWGERAYSDSQIQHAVHASSFVRMKRLESKNGRPFQCEQHKRQSTPFMRRGKQGDWVNHFDASDLAYLYDQCGDLMQRLGYDLPDALSRAG
jgi:estrone sulfotransferase